MVQKPRFDMPKQPMVVDGGKPKMADAYAGQFAYAPEVDDEAVTEVVAQKAPSRSVELAKKTESVRDNAMQEQRPAVQVDKESAPFSAQEQEWFAPTAPDRSVFAEPVEVSRPESPIGKVVSKGWASLRERMNRLLTPEVPVAPQVKADPFYQPRHNEKPLKAASFTFGLFSALAMTALLAHGVDSVKKNAAEQVASSSNSPYSQQM